MKPVIVVVGATGQQGGSVIKALVNTGQWTVRGLSRNLSSKQSQTLIEQGFELISGDIDSFDECVQAFQGAYGVFAMTNYWTSGFEKEFQQGMNMVRAAHQQGVQHFIWASLPDTMAISNGQLNLPHYMSKAQVESFIRQNDQPRLFLYATFIHVGFYYQNLQTFFQPNAELEFRVPLKPETRLPLYDVRDTGIIVARCFENPKRWGQYNVVPLVAEQLTMDELCQTIRHVCNNEKVRFVPLTYAECSDKTDEYLNNMRWYNEYGHYEDRKSETTKTVYDQMKTLAQWLEETKWLTEK